MPFLFAVAQMDQKPTSTEEYLATLTDERRAVLEEIRRTLRAAVPEAEAAFSYGMPALRLNGRALIWYAAWKHLRPLPHRPCPPPRRRA